MLLFGEMVIRMVSMTRDNEMARRFWLRFDDVMKSKNIQLRDVALASRLSYASIVGWRTKHLFPDVEAVCLMSQAVGCSIDYLMGSDIITRTIADDVYEYMEEMMPSLLEDIKRQVAFKKDSGLSGANAG